MQKATLLIYILVLICDLFLIYVGFKDGNTILMLSGILGIGLFISYFVKKQK